MTTIQVWVDEEHALARSGFRGVLRNLEGVDVELVVGPWSHGPGPGPRRPGAPLVCTSEERRMLGLIADGCGDDRIAECLEVSAADAGDGRRRLMCRLGLDRIAAEVRYARQIGLVDYGDPDAL